jgi:hypothetical protein
MHGVLALIAAAGRWRRAAHTALLLALCLIAGARVSSIAWGRFVLAFALIDVVGYIPGALAFRLARGRHIAPVYHYLYNTTHSYLTAAVGLALWAVAGHVEWAMLAIPIHLSGDRGLLGSFSRPVSMPFAPPRTASRGGADRSRR